LESLLHRRPATAALKVSFFGPFYGGYNVIALDREYRHAGLRAGSRLPVDTFPHANYFSEMKQQMLDVATRQGFDVKNLSG
jgi:apolipoprotein D and lipocalin family protein